MNCIKIAHNGSPSKLFETLLTISDNNESKATALYSQFNNPSFIAKFGNYKENYRLGNTNDRVDENGEPQLFKNEDGSYYYIDKEGNRISFPYNKKSLTDKLPYRAIKAGAHYLGMEYLTTVRNVNLENFDLQTVTNNIDLKEFISRKYNERIDILKNSKNGKDIITRKLLEDTLESIDEWIPYISDFYRTININHEYDENNDSTILDEENSRDASFGVNSFEQDSKKNVRTITRLKLATIKNPKGFNPLFGDAYLDYDEAFQPLKVELNDNYTYIDSSTGKVTDIAEVIISKLSNLSKKIPGYQEIINLMNTDDTFRTAMVASFKNQKNIILTNDMILVKNTETGEKSFIHTEKNISNSASYSMNLRRSWNSMYYNSLFDNNGVKRTYNEAQKINIENIKAVQEIISDIRNNAVDFDNNYQRYIDELIDVLNNRMGLNILPNAIFDFIEEQENSNPRMIRMNILLNTLKTDLQDISNKKLQNASSKKVVDFNLITNLGILREIASKQAIYEGANSGTMTRAGGKNIDTVSNINYLKNRIEVWKKNPIELIKYYNDSNDFVKSSVLLQHLLAFDVVNEDPIIQEQRRLQEMTNRLNKFNTAILTDVFVKYDATASKDSAIQELSLSNYITNDINKIIKGDYWRTTTQADKSSNFMIKSDFKHFSFSGFEGNRFNVNNHTVAIFNGYLESEIMRMVKVRDEINKIQEAIAEGNDIDLSQLKVHYHFKKGGISYTKDENGKVTSLNISKLGNAFQSQLFPDLNFKDNNSLDYSGKNQIKLERAQLVQQLRAYLYDYNKTLSDGSTNPNYGFIKQELGNGAIMSASEIVNSDGTFSKFDVLITLNNYIRNVLSDRIAVTHNSLVNDGIIEYNLEGNTFAMIDTNTLSEYKRYYDKAGIFKTPQDMNTLLGAAIATDYYIRSVINNVEYSKLFTGDLAYYKDMIDYKKRVPATYTDGSTLYLKPGEENFSIAVIDGVEIKASNLPYYNRLVQILGEDAANTMYNEVNSTDAQAWITPQRWEFLVKRLGKWSPVHDSYYRKMMSGRPETYTNEELKIAAQPLKGVYFGINKDGSPTYLKYSQAVLTPMLIKDTPLQKVYDKMREQVIDEVITLDGVKVGSPVPSTIHDNLGNIKEDFHFNKMILNNLDWKLQQDLPTKTYKDTDVGSQIQKNIFAGLIHNPNMEFEYDGKIVKGSDIINEITKEVKALSDKGLRSLFNELGIDPSTNKMRDPGRYYDSLIDELKSRDASRNIIEALEKRMSIAGIPQARLKLNNIFASIVNKKIIKIKTNGGAFIQMSNFGLNYNDVTSENSGIILHPDFLNQTENQGKTFEPYIYTDSETGRQRVSPGGIFISGSFIAKYIPNYRDYSSKELFGYTNEEGEFIQGVIDNRILENLVGYRIPNQGLASNDALQIVGILPEENGDTIVAYTGITTKTGSDFDIDKMYLMMPSYHLSMTNATKGKVLQELQKKLKGDTVKESIINFKSLYSQLTNETFTDGEINTFFSTSFNSEEINNVRTEAQNKVIDYLFDNLENPIVSDLLEQLNFDTQKKLVYDDQPNQKGYHANRLIQLYKSVLSNPNILSDVMKPIDLNYLKTDAVDLSKNYTEGVNSPLYHMEPIADIKLRYDFLSGKAGVGQEANSMVDISRVGDISIKNFKIDWFDSIINSAQKAEDRQHAINAKKGTINLDRQYSVNLSEKDLREYIEDLKSSGLSEKKINTIVQEITDIKISDGMSAIMNAFVDIAKDPFITRINWITSTTNVGNMLLRTGLHPLYVNAFLAQPVLRDFAQISKVLTPIKDIIGVDLYIRKLISDELKDNSETGNLSVRYLNNIDLSQLYYNSEYHPSFLKDTSGEPVYDLNERHNKFLKDDDSLASLPISPSHILNIAKISKDNPNYELAVNEAILIARDIYSKHYNGYLRQSDFNIETMSLRELRNSVKNGKADASFHISVLESFRKYKVIANILADNLIVSKTDTNGIGDNISNMVLYSNIVDNILTSEQNQSLTTPYLAGFKSKFENTPLGNYYTNLQSVYNIAKENQEFFPQIADSNIKISNYISNLLYKRNITNADLLKAIENDLYHDMMSKFFNLSISEKSELLSTIPDKIIELKKQYPENNFLKELTIKKTNSGIAKNILVLQSNKRSGTQENIITQGWNDLFKSDPQLAEDLVKYSFAITGFTTSPGQFFQLIPNTYFIDKDINNFVRHYVPNEDFIDQFVVSNEGVSIRVPFISKNDHVKVINADAYSILATQEEMIDMPTYIKDRNMIYRKRVWDNGILYYSAIYQAAGVDIDDRLIKEYGNSISTSSLVRKLENRINETNSFIEKLMTSDLSVVPIDSSDVGQYIPSSTEYDIQYTENRVIRLPRKDLKNIPQFDTNRNIINISEYSVFNNPFSGTKQSGKIQINPNNLTATQLNLVRKGYENPRLVLENIEESVNLYREWLIEGDYSQVPSDKFEALQKQRAEIYEQLYNKNSQLNQMLNNGAKIVAEQNTIHGSKYYTHADVLVSFIDEIRDSFEVITENNQDETYIDIRGNEYTGNTEVTTYETEVGPIRYVEDSEGNLSMLKEDISSLEGKSAQQENTESTPNINIFNVDTTIEVIDNAITNVPLNNHKLINQLNLYRNEVLMFDISKEDVEDYIKKCLNL